eukprot:363984-Chlamydomonas_euryale.AAC.13
MLWWEGCPTRGGGKGDTAVGLWRQLQQRVMSCRAHVPIVSASSVRMGAHIFSPVRACAPNTCCCSSCIDSATMLALGARLSWRSAWKRARGGRPPTNARRHLQVTDDTTHGSGCGMAAGGHIEDLCSACQTLACSGCATSFIPRMRWDSRLDQKLSPALQHQ